MLLVLHPFKFIDHYFFEYEMDIYKKYISHKFEIHDLSRIVNPNWNYAFKGRVHKKAKIFNNLNEWKIYFNNLIKKEEKVTILNNLNIDSVNSLLIHYEICKSKKNIIQYRSPSVSVIKEDQKIVLTYKRFLEIINPKNLNLKKTFYFFKSWLLRVAISALKFEKIFILVSGRKKNYRLLLNSKNNIFVNIHSKDYSKYLLQKKIKNKNKPGKYAVFLDLPGPYFANDYTLFNYKINHNVKVWYSDLNSYLRNIEKSFNLKIIIIPHPKVRQTKNPMYDKGLKVSKDIDATSMLIPDCEFVLSIAGSTSISYAIANKKPVILLYNDQIVKNQKRIYFHTKNMAEELDAPLININHKYEKKKFLKKINYKNYNKYKFDYLTSKKISKKLNYEIIDKIL